VPLLAERRGVTLRTKLATVAAALVLLGIAIGLSLTYVGLLRLRLGSLDDENRLLATLVYEAAVLTVDQPVRVPVSVGTYLSGERSTSAAQVYVDRQLIWAAGVATAPRPLDAERVLVGGGVATEGEWRVYTLRDDDTGVVVQVGRPLANLRAVLRPFPDLALAVTLFVTLLTGVLAWVMVGYALRPLRALTDATERFEDAADVPSIPGGDEPARLARAFAGLLQRLRAEREREHRFLAFAAHELRTPLSALRAGLEAVATGRLELQAEMVQRLHREATRLEALAQNLLALSTAEAGDAAWERLDLERVAADAYDRFLPLAMERGLRLSLSAYPAPVHGDARLLDQALANLVSNALRATTAGGIELRAGVADGVAYLEVVDSGPGIGPQAEGRGLGLRVVRAVAAAHGGGFEIAAREGTCARLWLPRARDAAADAAGAARG
jgi:two-component system, OmpR family, sensor kinase